jgi:hypothetical protein
VSIGLHGDFWSINLVATKTQGTRALDGIGKYDRGDIKLALLLAHLAMLVAGAALCVFAYEAIGVTLFVAGAFFLVLSRVDEFVDVTSGRHVMDEAECVRRMIARVTRRQSMLSEIARANAGEWSRDELQLVNEVFRRIDAEERDVDDVILELRDRVCARA